MDTSQSQSNQHSTARKYRARYCCVASIIMVVSSVLAIGFAFVNGKIVGCVAYVLSIPILFTGYIRLKACNKRILRVRAYLTTAIISAVIAVGQIVWISFAYAVCTFKLFGTPCTDKVKACLALSLISSCVAFLAHITASCITCDGVCLRCTVPMPHDSTQSEPQIDVAPDVDGLYTDWKIEKAEPRQEQFDPEKNYVLHTSVYKGLVLIINNDRFHEAKNRPGSELDLINIQHVFRRIGYEPVIMTNLSANEIRTFLDESVSRINLEGPICHPSVVLVLMSHGEKRGIYGTDSEVVTVQEIKSKFSGRQCPALIGKPKMFFIQACRGQMPTKSALDTDDPSRLSTIELVDDSDIDSCSSRRPTDHVLDVDGDVPDNGDIYVAYATSEGYFSIRDRVSGSWFIQSLCEELIAHVHIDDLDTIMNGVTRRVTGFTVSVIDGEGKKKKMLQTPDISKQGIGKKIYFMPNYPPRSDTACSLTHQPSSSSEQQGHCSTHIANEF